MWVRLMVVGAVAVSASAQTHGPTRGAVAQRGPLTLTVTGLKELKGNLQLGMFSRPETFPKDGQAAIGGNYPVSRLRCRRAADGSACVIRLANVPAGRYAIAVAHDLNGDGKIDRNPFSSEKKGISNYTTKLLSYPSWDKAVTNIGGSRRALTVELH